MNLFSYVVARDYGFAPNPFQGFCTLATCKPIIRRSAKVGDWVIGTGSAGYGLRGRLVYVMQISEKISFNDYWLGPRFKEKKPNLRGSLKQAYGDNIYRKDAGSERWLQEPSHHSFEDGTPNPENIANDTQTDSVLISERFTYWGGKGPLIPPQFRVPDSDMCALRGHKCNFSEALVEQFIGWFESLNQQGYMSEPRLFHWKSR